MTDNTNPTAEAMETLQTEQQATEETVAPAEQNHTAELAEWKDRAARLAAEMENLRKRTQKDIQDARNFAVTNFAKELLAVADNMERALEAMTNIEETETTKTMKEGVAMVSHQLTQAFKSANIEKFNSVDQQLDPEKHQVMTQIESDKEAGTIVQEMQAGYTLNDRLLRPALVAVSK